MNDVIEFLKDYIWKNGFEKLSEDPYAVYKAMVKSSKGKRGIDPKTARLVLVTLMSKTHEIAKNGSSDEEIVSHIQNEHCLNKKASKDIASMYLELSMMRIRGHGRKRKRLDSRNSVNLTGL